MNLKPLHGFVFIEDVPVPTERKTDSGLVLVTQKEPKVRCGRVLAVGEGLDKKGHKVVYDFNVGDIVLFGCYMGNQFGDNSIHEKSYRVVSIEQILCVIEDFELGDDVQSIALMFNS